MKRFPALAFMLVLSLSAFAGSERFIGTWKSNKAATLSYLKAHTKLTPQQLDKLGTALGTLTITFDKTNMTMRQGDWSFVSPYKIISETTNSITIESKDPTTQKISPTILELDSNGFWTPDDKIPGYKERFDKIAQK